MAARLTTTRRQPRIFLAGLRGRRFADLRLGIRVGCVDEGLAAGVAVVPVGATVAVFWASAIPADAALGVFFWCAVGSGL